MVVGVAVVELVVVLVIVIFIYPTWQAYLLTVFLTLLQLLSPKL